MSEEQIYIPNKTVKYKIFPKDPNEKIILNQKDYLDIFLKLKAIGQIETQLTLYNGLKPIVSKSVEDALLLIRNQAVCIAREEYPDYFSYRKLAELCKLSKPRVREIYNTNIQEYQTTLQFVGKV